MAFFPQVPHSSYVMRALTVQQRAEREYEVEHRRWSNKFKTKQRMIEDHDAAKVHLLARNEFERKRIRQAAEDRKTRGGSQVTNDLEIARVERECEVRLEKWVLRQAQLQSEFDMLFKRRPSRPTNENEVS